MTKSKTLVTDPVEFAKSWKSSRPCKIFVEDAASCYKNPYCLAWAARKCTIITGDIFNACHNMVSVYKDGDFI